MRTRKKFVVLAFATTTDALSMESFCTEHGVPGRTIPTPAVIVKSCGISWRMTPEDYADYREMLEKEAPRPLQEAEIELFE